MLSKNFMKANMLKDIDIINLNIKQRQVRENKSTIQISVF